MNFHAIPRMSCYIPSNGCMVQRKYSMTPEVPQCIKKLSAENQSKTVSVLLAVIIALTAAVPFLQPGHGKSINLITGGISA